MRRVLFIAYHFPPLTGSSGYLRTLKFVRYLPEFGFEPIVLTINPRAYELTDGASCSLIPEKLTIHRAFGLDTKRHLAIRGRYPGFFATPDRFASWIPDGIVSGVRMVQKLNVEVIFSTYPISSAHVVALWVSRFTGCPWVADFRDQMWDDYSQFSYSQLRVRKWVEAATVNTASAVVVTTNGIKELFRRRYPGLNPKRVKVVENGFDEDDFENVELRTRTIQSPVRLVHTGLLEPVDRDPLPFFKAISFLVNEHGVDRRDLAIDLIGSGNEDNYRSVLERLSLTDVVSLHQHVPYREALRRMSEADILLLFQGPSCNEQIPAKAYEYLRVGRPILALTPAHSETARLITSAQGGGVTSEDQPGRIASLLLRWIQTVKRGGTLPTANVETISKFSRRSQTALLTRCLESLVKFG